MGEHSGQLRSVWAGTVLSLCMMAVQSCSVAHAQNNNPSDRDSSTGSQASSADGGTSASGATYSGPPPWFNLRQPRMSTGIALAAVTRVVHRNQARLVECYTHELASNPRLHGVLTVKLQVIAGGFGSIDRVRFAPRNEALEGCVRSAVSSFEWPNPRGVASTDIELTIDLAPEPPPTVARPRR
jgi:hypothetical protein